MEIVNVVGGVWEDNMRGQEGRVGKGTEMGSKERDISIEGAIMGLWRNLIGKFPRIQKDDPS